MPNSHRAQRAAWIAVAFLWFVAMLNYFDRQLIVTMGHPIKNDLGIGDAYFGLFSSVFLWVYAFLQPLHGLCRRKI
jgi:predicted MFS family arabinose efflux permease